MRAENIYVSNFLFLINLLTWLCEVTSVFHILTVATPPGSKMRKPVTASGILALTHSPLLFMGKTGSVQKKTPCLLGKYMK